MRNASVVLAVGFSLIVAGCGGNDAGQRMAQGDKLLSEGKTAEAVIAFRAAIQADDRNGAARQKLGRALVRMGDIGKAMDELVRAADLLPNDATAQIEAAKALLAAGRFEDAKTRAEGVLKVDRQNVVAHIVRGTATAGLKNTEGALTAFEEAISLDPGRSASYLDLARLRASKGPNPEAEAAFKQAVAVAPQSIDARLALANYYWAADRPKDSEASLQDALKLDPKNVPANLGLVNLFLVTGRGKEAEGPLKVALDASPGNLGLRLALADYYVAQNRYPEARASLESLTKEPAAAAAAGARLAGVEYEQGSKERAHQLLDDLIKKEPNNSQLQVLKGGWLLNENNVAGALASATAAMKADQKSPAAAYLLGRVHLARNDPDEAEKAFTETLRLQPGAPQPQLALAQIDLNRGQAANAVTLSRQAANAAPNDVTSRFMLARALLASGDANAAAAELRTVLAAAPNAAEPLTVWGQIQEQRGDKAGAARSFARALELKPNLVDALLPLLRMDLAAKKPAAAIARLETQMAKAPKDPKMLLVAGRTYAAAGDLAKSEAVFRQAIDIDASTMDAYHGLGQILVRQKKLDEAIKAYSERVAERPNDIGAHTMVGMIQIVQGKRQDARQTFEKVLSLDPRAAVASNNLAYMDADAGTNLDVALNRAQVAKAALPEDADVNDTLGWIYVKQGLPALAISPLEQAIQKDGANPTYHYHLGVAHAKAGDRDRARVSLERALQISKAFDGAADAQRTLEGLRN